MISRKTIISITITVMVIYNGFTQIVPPPATSPTGLTIDGFFGLLLLTGLIYGIHKIYKNSSG